MKFGFLLFITLVSFTRVGFAGGALDMTKGALCQRALSHERFMSRIRDASDRVNILIRDESGEPIASFTAELHHQGREMSWGDMMVLRKREGLGHRLAAMVMQTQPQLRRIEAELLSDNYREFAKEYAAGASPKKAVMATPFYKIWSRQGFTRVESVSFDHPRLLEVVLNRPRSSRRN